MITQHFSYRDPESYPLQRLGDPSRLLFFDIETTGFAAASSTLYLIGALWREPETDSWHLVQYFADSLQAEAEVLSAFFALLDRFDTLVHFNGDGFDLPYLTRRCALLGLPCSFEALQSIDLYKRMKPCRRILGLENLKLKSLERFLGIDREDRYSGGELIEVYQRYLRTASPELRELLLLHNREDIRNMPGILPILQYPDLLSGTFSCRESRVFCRTDLFGREQPRLELTLQGAAEVPLPVEWESALAGMRLEGGLLRLQTELLSGRLRHYYPNYKDYYYLPQEDRVIHKSIGVFVDPEARQKATKENCFAAREGLFLRQPEGLFLPDFRTAPKARECYAELTPALFQDPGAVTELVRYYLNSKK